MIKHTDNPQKTSKLFQYFSIVKDLIEIVGFSIERNS